MKPQGSLPLSDQPVTGFDLEPDESIPVPFYFVHIYFNIILPSMPGFLRGLFPSEFPVNLLYVLVLKYRARQRNYFYGKYKRILMLFSHLRLVFPRVIFL
jgi:hypothetical protein